MESQILSMDKDSKPVNMSHSKSNMENTGNASSTPGTSGARQAYYPDDSEIPGTSGSNTNSDPFQRSESATIDDEWYLEVSYSSSDESVTSIWSGNAVKHIHSVQDNLSDSLVDIIPFNEVRSSASGSEIFHKYLYALGATSDSIKDGGSIKHVVTNRELDQDLTKQGFWMTHPEDKDDEVLITSPSHFELVYGSRSQMSHCSNQTALELLYYFQSNAQGEYDVFEKPILGDEHSTPWQQRLELKRRSMEQDLPCRNISNNSAGINMNANGATVDQYARVASWLDEVQPKTDKTSKYVRPSCSDTEVYDASRKRKRDESKLLESWAKRSKSESNIGEERPTKKRRHTKAGSRRSKRS